ncbi:MAG: flagellar biosynthesis protein FlhB [bacterium]|nr:flagellar biosynthesis protein FlhB [bacterium]
MDSQLLLEYNLQFFAKDGPGGEKTEDATPKKLTDARKDGQVAKSKELGNGVALLALFLTLKYFIGSIGTQFIETFYYVYSRIPEMITMENGGVSIKLFASMISELMVKVLVILLPIFIVAVVTAFVTDLVQVKWKPTTKPLQPKFSKLDPIKGFKRFFSKEKLMELLKSVIKIVMIAYLAYSTIKDQFNALYLLYDMTLLGAVQAIGDIVINLGIKISIFYLILGFADYLYQKYKFKEDMKMTKQEVKDEMKNSEGDPQIKGKQRRRMQEASRRRMMSALPQADVVITNPTHFAVALKYDTDICPAPYVIAKGEDYLALKIKETAKEHGIPIEENKPLARMLYHNVDIGTAIPPELYQVVAEILAAIYKSKNKAG